MAYKRNAFVVQMLQWELQGRNSYSQPRTWNSPPADLLVETPLLAQMRVFARRVVEDGHAPWIFLVGGPGNGKSEALGEFARTLDELDRNARVFSQIESETAKNPLPRDITIILSNGHSIHVIQDASVLPDYFGNVAQHLVDDIGAVLGLDRCSMFVCANRGVLEGARRLARPGSPEYAILQRVCQDTAWDAPGPPPSLAVNLGSPGRQVEVWSCPLDQESILMGEGDRDWNNPRGSLFDKILQRAVDESNWEGQGCAGCDASAVCPFFQDALWLRSPPRRESVLRVLRSAEVLDGRRMVLREGLALTAHILAGSSHTFRSNTHPCEWIEEQHRNLPRPPLENLTFRNWVALLSLASHRIYMDVWGNSSPAGLSPSGDDREAFSRLAAHFPQLGRAIRLVHREARADTGVGRLTGTDGVLGRLDPVLLEVGELGDFDPDSLPADVRDAVRSQWGGPVLPEVDGLLLAALDWLDASVPDDAIDAAALFAAVRRWGSTYALRMVGLLGGVHPLAAEIEVFLDALRDPGGSEIPVLLMNFLAPGNRLAIEVRAGLRYEVAGPQLPPAPGLPRPRVLPPEYWPASDELVCRCSGGILSQPIDIRVGCQLVVAILREERLGLQRWCYPPDVESLLEQTLRAIGAAARIQRQPLAAYRQVQAWAEVADRRREIRREGLEVHVG